MSPNTTTPQEEETKTMTNEIRCFNVVPGSTGAGGWDLDVALTIAGREYRGALTLLPDVTGRPAAWGDPDMWISDGLLAVFRDIEAPHPTFEVLEAAARSAILESGIMPADETLTDEQVAGRLDILADSDATCDGCGRDPRRANDAARDPRWFMDTIHTPDAVIAQIRCPACW